MCDNNSTFHGSTLAYRFAQFSLESIFISNHFRRIRTDFRRSDWIGWWKHVGQFLIIGRFNSFASHTSGLQETDGIEGQAAAVLCSNHFALPLEAARGLNAASTATTTCQMSSLWLGIDLQMFDANLCWWHQVPFVRSRLDHQVYLTSLYHSTQRICRRAASPKKTSSSLFYTFLIFFVNLFQSKQKEPDFQKIFCFKDWNDFDCYCS